MLYSIYYTTDLITGRMFSMADPNNTKESFKVWMGELVYTALNERSVCNDKNVDFVYSLVSV